MIDASLQFVRTPVPGGILRQMHPLVELGQVVEHGFKAGRKGEYV